MPRKQLTHEERTQIEHYLTNGLKFAEISRQLSRPIGTISKEVQRNRIMRNPQSHWRQKSYFCLHNESCLEKIDPLYCQNRCRNFEENVCPTVSKAPYVCNGCEKKSRCPLRRFFYKSIEADQEATRIKRESRAGINLTHEELVDLNQLISPLIRAGQPIQHIFETHKEELSISIRTLYTYIEHGLLDVKNIDLRRKVSYKKRKTTNSQPVRSRSYRKNRTYADFLAEIHSNPEQSIVEMDLVEGKRSAGEDQFLLTLFFRETKFMLIRLLPNKKSESVVRELLAIEQAISTPEFTSLFGIILTDNGSEFSQPEAIEAIDGDFYRTKLFYCDPGHSEQKGALEKNHEFIRYILPKGTSFNELTKEDVNVMTSHINSISRPTLGGKTPFDLAEFLWPASAEIFDQLHLMKIPPDEVILTHQLFQ